MARSTDMVSDSSLDWGLNTNSHPFQFFVYGNVKDYLEQSIKAASESGRKKARQSFFRGLGELMHLVEDLGQPQHTREDPHGGGSDYEAYVENKIRRHAEATHSEGSVDRVAQ